MIVIRDCRVKQKQFPNALKKKSLVNKHSDHFMKDILDQAIETSLKEYEILNAEISQRSQNIIQFIFLGLAAIATIISFTLPQFVNFVTSEDITIQPIHQELCKNSSDVGHETSGENLQENQKSDSSSKKCFGVDINLSENNAVINIPSIEEEGTDEISITFPKRLNLDLSNIQNRFKINRTTEEQGAASAKWIFVIVYAFILPWFCLYIIDSVMRSAKVIALIQEYIANKIEHKTNIYFTKQSYPIGTKKIISWKVFIKKVQATLGNEYFYFYRFFMILIYMTCILSLFMATFNITMKPLSWGILIISNIFIIVFIEASLSHWLGIEKKVNLLLLNNKIPKWDRYFQKSIREFITYIYQIIFLRLFEIFSIKILEVTNDIDEGTIVEEIKNLLEIINDRLAGTNDMLPETNDQLLAIY
ncbi:MAG: hypothetical protein AB4372_24555, partial [Xenococcus sp. (in: cyanobacteria)]